MEGYDMPTIQLYKNNSDRRVLSKNIYAIGGVRECKFLSDNISISSPSLLLEYNPKYITERVNYVYIKDFSRYYYVTNMTVNTGGLCVLQCDVDVLMSFKTYIKQIKTTIARQEFINSPLFADNEYMVRVDHNIDRYVIGDLTSQSAYYITVNGGGQENNE